MQCLPKQEQQRINMDDFAEHCSNKTKPAVFSFRTQKGDGKNRFYLEAANIIPEC